MCGKVLWWRGRRNNLFPDWRVVVWCGGGGEQRGTVGRLLLLLWYVQLLGLWLGPELWSSSGGHGGVVVHVVDVVGGMFACLVKGADAAGRWLSSLMRCGRVHGQISELQHKPMPLISWHCARPRPEHSINGVLLSLFPRGIVFARR